MHPHTCTHTHAVHTCHMQHYCVLTWIIKLRAGGHVCSRYCYLRPDVSSLSVTLSICVHVLCRCMSVSSPAVSKSTLRTMGSDEHLRTNDAQLSERYVCVSVCFHVLCVCASALVDSCLQPLAADTACHVPPSKSARCILLLVCMRLCAHVTSSDLTAQDVCIWLPQLPVVSFYRVPMSMQLQVRRQPDKAASLPQNKHMSNREQRLTKTIQLVSPPNEMTTQVICTMHSRTTHWNIMRCYQENVTNHC